MTVGVAVHGSWMCWAAIYAVTGSCACGL